MDLNGHTLTVSDTLSVASGDVLVNGGALNVGSYIQSEGMKLVLNSNNDVKNVHVSESFLIDDWSDIQFGSNVTVNVNTYVTGNHTVLNGPGTNYWAPSNPDTLHGTFAKGIWQENSYCYIEYPIYNASGTVTEYRRGYVADMDVTERFAEKTGANTTAYIEDGSVYNLPSTSSQNLGTFVGVVAVTILDEENGLYYIEYLYNGTGPSKRGYVEKSRIFQAATAIALSAENVYLHIGQTYPLSVVFTPENPKKKEVIWSSSDPNVVKVDNGVLTAVGRGIATVTATAKVGGASDSCVVETYYQEFGDFSSLITDYIQNEDRLEEIMESEASFDNWPASEDSHYCELSYEDRTEKLQEIINTSVAGVLGGYFLNMPDASRALKHYLNRSGTTLIIDVNRACSESELIYNKRKKVINNLLEACENIVPNNTTKTIFNRKRIEETFKITDSPNWQNTLGKYEILVKCQVYHNSENTYTANVTYKIVDFYNWDKTKGQEGLLPVSQHDLWELHHGGFAKDFLVEGASNLMITWESGQRWDTGAIIEVQNDES